MSKVDVWMPFPEGEGPDNWPKRYVSEADYEALRAEVERLNNVDHNSDLWCERATKAEAEVDRLRAALEVVAKELTSIDVGAESRAFVTAYEALRLPDPTQGERWISEKNIDAAVAAINGDADPTPAALPEG